MSWIVSLFLTAIILRNQREDLWKASRHFLRYYTSVGGGIEEPSQGLNQQQMRRVMDFVQAHLDQELSLEALAQQIGFSPYHFARLFRQTTGESPHQFVLRQRIERKKKPGALRLTSM